MTRRDFVKTETTLLAGSAWRAPLLVGGRRHRATQPRSSFIGPVILAGSRFLAKRTRRRPTAGDEVHRHPKLRCLAGFDTLA